MPAAPAAAGAMIEPSPIAPAQKIDFMVFLLFTASPIFWPAKIGK
jgi:hypothetical protein